MRKIEWKLDDLWPVTEFDKRFAQVEGEIANINKWWERLNGEMEIKEFREFLEWSEVLEEKMAILGSRPGLMEAVNVNDREAKVMKSKITELALKMADESRKIEHWLKGLSVEGKESLSETQAKRLFGAIKDLEYGLWHGRRAAKHTLAQREEMIIDYKDTYGIGPLNELREMITTELKFEMKIGGETKIIENQSELLKYTHSPDPQEREASYRALLTKYGDNMDKLFVIYQGVVKDWGFEARLRGYKSPISVRNFANDIPDGVVSTLLDVTRKNRDIFWRYFKFKAKVLGMKKLKRWDVYAPLTSKQDTYSWEEAVDLTLGAFGEFSKGFKQKAELILKNEHVDVYPGEAKSSGAFCATISPKITPYVMLNFTGQTRDVSTLAHELGHGVHSLFAQNHYPSSQHSALPLAETASTLGEMMLFEKLFEKADAETKRAMLSDKIADSYATILRQNYFVRFEIEAHELISKGIKPDELSKVYLNNLREQFGEAVETDESFANEWLYVSHFFETPFYCYAYNFGELLSLALYQEYKEKGKIMSDKIERILTFGGSEDPFVILKEADIDVTQESFWQKGFEVLRGWQEMMERL
ncbi:MAG: M3 family oligoendopeptidase [Candidatus Shapirobacteria bacterium]